MYTLNKSNIARKITASPEGKKIIKIDNGHIKALQKIVNDYNLKSGNEANFLFGKNTKNTP